VTKYWLAGGVVLFCLWVWYGCAIGPRLLGETSVGMVAPTPTRTSGPVETPLRKLT